MEKSLVDVTSGTMLDAIPSPDRQDSLDVALAHAPDCDSTVSIADTSEKSMLGDDAVAAAVEPPGDTANSSLAKPLCEMLLCMFDFQEKTVHLKESAALRVLKQGIMGSMSDANTDE